MNVANWQIVLRKAQRDPTPIVVHGTVTRQESRVRDFGNPASDLVGLEMVATLVTLDAYAPKFEPGIIFDYDHAPVMVTRVERVPAWEYEDEGALRLILAARYEGRRGTLAYEQHMLLMEAFRVATTLTVTFTPRREASTPAQGACND